MFRGKATGLVATILLACLGLANPVYAQSAVDLEGKSVNPFEAAQRKVVVLVFVRRDCPISSRYAPVIQKISADHQRDASFWLVFPDKAETGPAIRKYLKDYQYEVPGVRDPQHVLVKLAQAQITPEAAVFDSQRHLVYHGRIDNLYVEFGRSRPAPTTHELSDAIEAALSGKPLVHGAVEGVGCYISDLD